MYVSQIQTVDGKSYYTKEDVDMIQSRLNRSNSGGGTTMEVFEDTGLTEPILVSMRHVVAVKAVV